MGESRGSQNKRVTCHASGRSVYKQISTCTLASAATFATSGTTWLFIEHVSSDLHMGHAQGPTLPLSPLTSLSGQII